MDKFNSDTFDFTAPSEVLQRWDTSSSPTVGGGAPHCWTSSLPCCRRTPRFEIQECSIPAAWGHQKEPVGAVEASLPHSLTRLLTHSLPHSLIRSGSVWGTRWRWGVCLSHSPCCDHNPGFIWQKYSSNAPPAGRIMMHRSNHLNDCNHFNNSFSVSTEIHYIWSAFTFSTLYSTAVGQFRWWSSAS